MTGTTSRIKLPHDSTGEGGAMSLEEADQPTRAATVHDVARVAGVSAQTVSRLIKGYPGIRDATRERVEAAIEQLHYRPNTVARLLRTQKSTRIGAVVHQMFDYGPGSLLRGAAIGARDAGYSLNIVGVDGNDASSIGDAFETFEEERVAGILAITLTDSVRSVVERRLPDVPILVDPAEAMGDGPSMNDSGAPRDDAGKVSSTAPTIAIVANVDSSSSAGRCRKLCTRSSNSCA